MTSTQRITGIVTATLALAVAAPAPAQEEGARPTHDPETRIERLAEALDLTEGQVAEVRSIFTEQAEKGRELRSAADREAMRAHWRETHERMVAILTEEQRERLAELREERAKHRRHGAEGRHRSEGRHRGQPGEAGA